MKYAFLPILGIILLISACQEEEVATPSATQYISWTEGDWWAYEWVVYNYNTGDTNHLSTDTIFALADTMINGETFRTLSSEIYPFQQGRSYLRDSSGYVINEQHQIIYSYTNFSDTLVQIDDNGVHRFSMMIQDPSSTVVPAGVFNTINYQTVSWVDGMNYACTQDTMIRSDLQFADGVGMVRLSYHYSAPGPCIDNVRNLISYYIQ